MQTGGVTSRAIEAVPTVIAAPAHDRTVAHGLSVRQALIDPIVGGVLTRRVRAGPVQLKPLSLLTAETHDTVFGLGWVEDIARLGTGRSASTTVTTVGTSMIGWQATEGTGGIPGGLVFRRVGRVVGRTSGMVTILGWRTHARREGGTVRRDMMHLMMVRSLRTIVGRVAVGTGQTKTASSIAAIGVDTGMVVRRLLSFQGMRRP